MRTAEPKRTATSVTKLEVFHNVLLGQTYLLNASGIMPTSATNQVSRIGDQINVEGFRLRLLFGQKADRPNVTWRFMIVQVPKGGSVAYNDLFRNVTGNVMLDEVNGDYTKVLMDKTYRPNQASLAFTGVREYTFIKKLYFKHKKLYKFGPGENVVTHNHADIHVVLLAYDAFGSAISDNIGYVQMFHQMDYKDP